MGFGTWNAKSIINKSHGYVSFSGNIGMFQIGHGIEPADE
jgi:hypothetical protein